MPNKAAETGPGGGDEFDRCQNHLKERIVTARAQIQDKNKIERRQGNVVELRRARNAVETALAELDDTLGQLKTILRAVLESPKATAKTKEDRASRL